MQTNEVVQDISHLVVLRFSQNEAYTRVENAKSVDDPLLVIHVPSKSWSYNSDAPRGLWDYITQNKIGKGCATRRWAQCQGVIGVYDRNNASHLQQMLNDAETVARQGRRGGQ